MGKSRTNKGTKAWEDERSAKDDQAWQDRGRDRGSYRGFWPGAWKSREKYSPRAKAQPNSFPKYDADWKDPAGIEVVTERRQPEAQQRHSLARIVQDAANLLRKAEGRLNKLNSDIHEKARRWEAYQAELRASFLKEYQRHLNALDRLEQDIMDATAHEANATGVLARAMAGVPQPTQHTHAVQAWESLMTGIQSGTAMDVDADMIGRRLDELMQTGGASGSALDCTSGVGEQYSVVWAHAAHLCWHVSHCSPCRPLHDHQSCCDDSWQLSAQGPFDRAARQQASRTYPAHGPGIHRGGEGTQDPLGSEGRDQDKPHATLAKIDESGRQAPRSTPMCHGTFWVSTQRGAPTARECYKLGGYDYRSPARRCTSWQCDRRGKGGRARLRLARTHGVKRIVFPPALHCCQLDVSVLQRPVLLWEWWVRPAPTSDSLLFGSCRSSFGRGAASLRDYEGCDLSGCFVQNWRLFGIFSVDRPGTLCLPAAPFLAASMGGGPHWVCAASLPLGHVSSAFVVLVWFYPEEARRRFGCPPPTTSSVDARNSELHFDLAVACSSQEPDLANAVLTQKLLDWLASWLDDLHLSALPSEEHCQVAPCEPAVDDRSDGSERARTVVICRVFAPHFHVILADFDIPLPCPQQAFLDAARSALRFLDSGFNLQVAPTIPQLAADHGSLILFPDWVHTSGLDVVVFDFLALGGPTYSAYVDKNMRYGDCLREAQHQGLYAWEVFAFGHSRPLAPGDTLLAITGGVLQFRPVGPDLCPQTIRNTKCLIAQGYWSSLILGPPPAVPVQKTRSASSHSASRSRAPRGAASPEAATNDAGDVGPSELSPVLERSSVAPAPKDSASSNGSHFGSEAPAAEGTGPTPGSPDVEIGLPPTRNVRQDGVHYAACLDMPKGHTSFLPFPRWDQHSPGAPALVFTRVRPAGNAIAGVDPALMPARFLLFAPRVLARTYVDMEVGISAQAALSSIQAQRSQRVRALFPEVTFAHPQPVDAFALCIALPSWTQDKYVVLDCSRMNGAIFCGLCAPVTTRASLLAIARLPRHANVEVYVHDRVTPLGEQDAIGIDTGFCVSFVPLGHLVFTVTRIQDMLQDPLSWNREAPLPGLDGRWFLLLTDDEPTQFLRAPWNTGSQRADIAQVLGYDPARLVIQPTRPNLLNHFDFGIWGSAVFITTQSAQPSQESVLYVLDMRPILCGLTWDVAKHGRVAVDPILQRFRPICPDGFSPDLSGKHIQVDTQGRFCIVDPGAVLTVTFLPAESRDPGPPAPAEEDPPDSDSDGDRSEPSDPGPTDSGCASIAASDPGTSNTVPGPAHHTAPEGAMAAAQLQRPTSHVDIRCAIPGRASANAYGSCASRDAMWRKVFFVVALASGNTWEAQLEYCVGNLDCAIQGADLADFAQASAFCPALRQWSRPGLTDALASACKDYPVNDIVCFTDGSYTAVEKGPDLCGWACVLFHPASQSTRFLYGSFPVFLADKDFCPSPFQGEVAGLLAAALATTASATRTGVHFLSDCASALGIAEGACSFAQGTVAQAMRHAHWLRSSCVPGRDSYRHIRGHQGHVGNEVADLLAKAAARKIGPSCGLHTHLPLLCAWLGEGAPYLPWAGLAMLSATGDSSLPPCSAANLGDDTGHSDLTGDALLEPFLPQGALSATDVSCDRTLVTDAAVASGSWTMSIVLTTFNTLSLGPSLEQEGAFCDSVEGLAFRPARAVLLASQLAEHGVHAACLQETSQWGTEWWFQENHQLGVRSQAFMLPTEPLKQSPWKNWWKQTDRLVKVHCRDEWVVFAGDCNAAVGSISSDHIGPHGAETEDAAGEHLHSILRHLDGCVPATISELHSGPTHTYTHKRGGGLSRLDYLCIPRSWLRGRCRSYPAPSIHAAHSCPDHVALVLNVQLPIQGPSMTPALRPRSFRAADIVAAGNADALARALSELPAVPWNVSAHAHAAILVSCVQRILTSLKHKSGPRQHRSYLRPATWQLQQQVAAARRSLHRLQHQMRCQRLAVCFDTWCGRRAAPEPCVGDSWWREADVAVAAHQAVLGQWCLQLRHACRTDRADYISSLADKISTGPSGEIFHNLHAILSHKRKKPYRAEPLPALLLEDGTPCADGDQAGVELTVPALVAKVQQGIAHDASDSPSWPLPDSLLALPTEADIQRLLVQAKANKAPGPDGLPPELGRQFSKQLAPHLHRLALKTAFRGCEPAGFKSGKAVWFYKGKGSMNSCSSYRAILLLPSWSKILHQSLRPSLKHHFQANSPELQLGGKSGISVVFGSHLIRGAARYAASLGRTHFTLFTDIASAFYTVIQQLVARNGDQPIAESVFRQSTLGLQLSFEEKEAFYERLGASPWLEALTSRYQDGNFFMLKGDDRVVATSRGSRPGSSWADLVFPEVITRILQRRDALRDAGRPCSEPVTLPWDGERTLAPVATPCEELSLDNVVWADDVALPRLTTPAQAASALAFETSCLVDSFKEFGFSLAFGPHKTAGVLHLLGAGSRAAKRHIFGSSGLAGAVPVVFENGSVHLPLVSSYRHLGTQPSPGGGLCPELRYRIAQARASFAEGRRKVYKVSQISVRRKAHILCATVLAKLFHGAGSWGPLGKCDYRLLQGALWSFYRPLLGIKHSDDQHIDTFSCLALLELPSLSTADRAHASLLQEDLCWLHQWTWNTIALPCPVQSWPEWLAFIEETPRKFKALVKRARALDGRRIQCIAALQCLHKALIATFGSQHHTTSPASVESQAWAEVCIPCRRAWAGHCARKHGYRNHAFLCAVDTLCQSCGKRFSSVGRPRRHLTAHPACIAAWGSFLSAGDGSTPLHVQALPECAPGLTASDKGLGIRTDVSLRLLEELSSLEAPDDSLVWELVTSYVEPLDVLKATIHEWQNASDTTPERDAVCRNVLLLLDVDLLADSRQPLSTPRRVISESVPDWPLPRAASLVCGAPRQAFLLASPPSVHLNPWRPKSNYEAQGCYWPCRLA
ncbi:unnamed protein product [Symbiodinium sp. CCMP2592]|nr:unnamed protein product [Symbiodinium sp. CCMP2592]